MSSSPRSSRRSRSRNLSPRDPAAGSVAVRRGQHPHPACRDACPADGLQARHPRRRAGRLDLPDAYHDAHAPARRQDGEGMGSPAHRARGGDVIGGAGDRERIGTALRTHGLRATYVNGKCRCEECAAANDAYQTARSRRGQVPPGGLHGYSGYINYGCRCEVCTVAHREQADAYEPGRRPRRKKEGSGDERAGA
jgi:hypothetical protein